MPIKLSPFDQAFLDGKHGEGSFETPIMPKIPSLRYFISMWLLLRLIFIFFLGVILYVFSDPFLIMIAQRFADSQFANMFLFFSSVGLSEDVARSVAALILSLSPIILILLINLPLDLMKRKRVWEKYFEKKVARISSIHENLSKKRVRLLEKKSDAERDLARYENDKITYAQSMQEYRKKVLEEETRYTQECDRVSSERHALWDHARICMRCGTAYLS